MPNVLVLGANGHLGRALVSDLLHKGYQVRAASHGKDALELLLGSEDLPRLILLDLMMPVLSGW